MNQVLCSMLVDHNALESDAIVQKIKHSPENETYLFVRVIVSLSARPPDRCMFFLLHKGLDVAVGDLRGTCVRWAGAGDRRETYVR